MSDFAFYKGFVKDIRWEAHVTDPLPRYPLDGFDINKAAGNGLIEIPDGTVGYSKWTSPKRTRTYPLARIYNTFNTQKKITVIPIIKDEGIDGDMDKIQASTISWMSLLNIYIVLAYYETADRKPIAGKRKITNQKFNVDFVNAQIHEILRYHQSALHWNRSLVEERFTDILNTAVGAYDQIAQRTETAMHSRVLLRNYLRDIGQDIQQFWNISLKASQGATLRELHTIHQYEALSDGDKGQFHIQNYLGGVYYLTPDEVYKEGDTIVIQESKNATRGRLPKVADVRDGLFKLILYSNLDRVERDGVEYPFITRLKLTGQIRESLTLPAHDKIVDAFARATGLSKVERTLLGKLNQEAETNHISVLIKGSN